MPPSSSSNAILNDTRQKAHPHKPSANKAKRRRESTQPAPGKKWNPIKRTVYNPCFQETLLRHSCIDVLSLLWSKVEKSHLDKTKRRKERRGPPLFPTRSLCPSSSSRRSTSQGHPLHIAHQDRHLRPLRRFRDEVEVAQERRGGG